jgi:hypothetical protein
MSTSTFKLRGPVLDMCYARLRRCGNLACTGRPFTSTGTSQPRQHSTIFM